MNYEGGAARPFPKRAQFPLRIHHGRYWGLALLERPDNILFCYRDAFNPDTPNLDEHHKLYYEISIYFLIDEAIYWVTQILLTQPVAPDLFYYVRLTFDLDLMVFIHGHSILVVYRTFEWERQ